MPPKLKHIFFLLFCCPISILASTITGFEPDYASRSISFYTYSDPITKKGVELFTIEIDHTGHFSKEVDLKKVVVCYADFDVYTTILVVEPSKNIKIKLPPLKGKTYAEKKNPFFKPVKLWMKVEPGSDDEINTLCSSFENRFNFLTDKYFNQLYFRQSNAMLDSVANTLKGEFKEYLTPFFKNFALFKLKILEVEVLRKNQDNILHGFNPGSFSFNNPAFIDLVDRAFTNKLVFEANSVKGKEVSMEVGKGNLAFLKKLVKNKYGLTERMDDFIILKLLYDAYYSSRFSKRAILKMLDNEVFSKNKSIEIQEFAKSIKTKLLFLAPGTVATEICLEDFNRNTLCTNEGDNHKYILFADMELQICREHLKYLPVIAKKYNQKLDIFIIIENKKTEKIWGYLNEHKIPGTILFDEKQVYSDKYNVRLFPTCYLFNGKHEVVLAPAKPPLDGFEHQFGRLLQSEQIKQMRSQ